MAELMQILRDRLQLHREAALWKIEGLSDFDMRRPLTATGTNLLGTVKHLATVELGYFGDVFSHPSDISMPWLASPWSDNADMWATPAEAVDHIIDLYRTVWAHADELFDSAELDRPGVVPWWPPERRETNLGTVLVHVIAETARHVGQMDILREGIDEQVGTYATNSNMVDHDATVRAAYVQKLQAVADEFRIQ